MRGEESLYFGRRISEMKDNATSTKLKHARSSSNSSPFTISDDESPKTKKCKNRKSLGERHNHRKHHKHNHRTYGQHASESSSEDESKAKYRASKIERYKESSVISVSRVKEEPLSENENERKHKSRQEQSRLDDDTSNRTDSRHHRDESRRRNELETRNTSNRCKKPIKEESRSDAEPEWGKKEIKDKKEPVKNIAKPDFGLSGKLTEDANTFNGVVIKYSEPPEARKPKRRWRLYPFKGENSLPVLHIHRQSAYLMGRDRKIADIPIDHPSCSKQHAALQYRLVPFTRSNGSSGRQIKLYVIDLESANGTFLNNNKIEPRKYHELKERDVVKFGFSSREYVLLHEHSKDSENDDDVRNDD